MRHIRNWTLYLQPLSVNYLLPATAHCWIIAELHICTVVTDDDDGIIVPSVQ